MMRLAVPRGRLWQNSLSLLDVLGIPAESDDRRYVFRHPTAPLEVVVLKLPDIPTALEEGLVDLAVTSDEWLAEHGVEHRSLVTLCWYHARICVLGPRAGGPVRRTTSTGLSVATPYPRLAARHLSDSSRAIRIRAVSGAVEAYPGVMTDVAVDCVETGATATANGLVVVDEVMRCDVRLVSTGIGPEDHAVVGMVVAAATAGARDVDCRWAATLLPSGSS